MVVDILPALVTTHLGLFQRRHLVVQAGLHQLDSPPFTAPLQRTVLHPLPPLSPPHQLPPAGVHASPRPASHQNLISAAILRLTSVFRIPAARLTTRHTGHGTKATAVALRPLRPHIPLRRARPLPPSLHHRGPPQPILRPLWLQFLGNHLGPPPLHLIRLPPQLHPSQSAQFRRHPYTHLSHTPTHRALLLRASKRLENSMRLLTT
jgi:hypothetical protein